MVSMSVLNVTPCNRLTIDVRYSILEIISFAAVLVNSGLVAFTGTLTVNYAWYDRIWIFIAMSSSIFAIKIIISLLIPDTPQEVEIQLKRREYILDKIVNNIPDDSNEVKAGIQSSISNHVIKLSE